MGLTRYQVRPIFIIEKNESAGKRVDVACHS